MSQDTLELTGSEAGSKPPVATVGLCSPLVRVLAEHREKYKEEFNLRPQVPLSFAGGAAPGPGADEK